MLTNDSPQIRFPPIADVDEINKGGAMRRWHVLLVLGLSFHAAIGWAQTSSSLPLLSKRQLSGLREGDAAALIAKLEKAQRRLKAGKFQSFELLAGSAASFEETKISPRSAFLQAQFEKVWNVQRVITNADAWRPRYRLSYSPIGPREAYWDMEVDTSLDGDIQRVTMIYKPPPPF